MYCQLNIWSPLGMSLSLEEGHPYCSLQFGESNSKYLRRIECAQELYTGWEVASKVVND